MRNAYAFATLVRRRPAQVQANLRLHPPNAHHQLDQVQPQRVELRDPPVRSAR